MIDNGAPVSRFRSGGSGTVGRSERIATKHKQSTVGSGERNHRLGVEEH